MTYQHLETIVIDFDEFRRGYYACLSSNPEPVYIEAEGVTGRQRGSIKFQSQYALEVPDRYIPISKFVERVENRPSPVETRHEVELQLPDDVSDEEFEEEVARDYHALVENWWSSILLTAVDVDGHTIDIEWMDGDEPLGLHLYFRDKDLL
ncbi:hypothetical protein [Haloprofundus halobius]|uniref:hypothetical protein n=1 Tax=Haloprofundus halobius TaxID=2876194 RepID=UPI001CCE0AD8|nr:hypothetical protein [Haloprofundus halobius]